jgi:hypothetical protein
MANLSRTLTCMFYFSPSHRTRVAHRGSYRGPVISPAAKERPFYGRGGIDFYTQNKVGILPPRLLLRFLYYVRLLHFFRLRSFITFFWTTFVYYIFLDYVCLLHFFGLHSFITFFLTTFVYYVFFDYICLLRFFGLRLFYYIFLTTFVLLHFSLHLLLHCFLGLQFPLLDCNIRCRSETMKHNFNKL